MATPRPGRQGARLRDRPPAHGALDLLGRRWALRVLWELREASV